MKQKAFAARILENTRFDAYRQLLKSMTQKKWLSDAARNRREKKYVKENRENAGEIYESGS